MKKKNGIKTSKTKQIEKMREWFFERYEDPVHHTPYMSSEGGYQWIYGGPFDAYDILSDQFGGKVNDDVIAALAEELSEESWEWTRTQSYDAEIYPDDSDELLLSTKSSADWMFLLNLNSSLKNLEEISKSPKSASLELIQYKEMMIFSFVITAMETYMSDVFMRVISKSEEAKIKFLKFDSSLSARKINLSDVFSERENIEKTIIKRIGEMSFHNIALINSLFSDVLALQLGDISLIASSVVKRHDFVHRGGKNLDGIPVFTDQEEIKSLILDVKRLCEHVDSELIKVGLIEACPF